MIMAPSVCRLGRLAMFLSMTSCETDQLMNEIYGTETHDKLATDTIYTLSGMVDYDTPVT
jgi:hypothetical protein